MQRAFLEVVALGVCQLHRKAYAGKIKSMTFLAFGGSGTVARNLTSNYVFKPTPDQALGSNRACGRRGLTRR